MIEIFKGEIENLHNNTNCDYKIMNGNDLQTFGNASISWQESFVNHIAELRSAASSEDEFNKLIDDARLGDFHWNWTAKSFHLNSDEYEWFHLEADNNVQSIALIYHPKNSKIDNKEIFYIEYISTAPWNRKSAVQTKKFSGLGTIMIEDIVKFFIKKYKYRPGFCLHSLEQTEGYYKKIGMTEFGHDSSKDNMNYFEMDEKNSQRLIA